MLSAGAGAWVLPRISMWSPSWWKRFRKPSSWNIKMSSERIFQPQRSSGYSKTRVHLQKIWGWSLEMHQNLVQVEREPHEPMNANWGSGIDLEIPAESDGANGFRYFKEKDESKSSCDKYIYVIDIREYESSDSMKLWFTVVWMYLRHQCDTPLQGIFLKTVSQLCWTGQDDHCQFFLYQILRGMKYVHSAQARLMCWGRVAACRLAKAKIQVPGFNSS